MSDCILCSGALNGSGYGSASYLGKQRGAHVVAYMKAHGLTHEDVAGKVVMHSCDNRPCINPEHLSLGTKKLNSLDMVAKGRNTYPVYHGEAHANCSLPDTAVQQIRARLIKGAKSDNPDSARALALEFGISVTHVHRVYGGESRVRATCTIPA